MNSESKPQSPGLAPQSTVALSSVIVLSWFRYPQASRSYYLYIFYLRLTT